MPNDEALKKLVKDVEPLIIEVKAYLERPSTDGHPSRKQMRKRIAELIENITYDFYNSD